MSNGNPNRFTMYFRSAVGVYEISDKINQFLRDNPDTRIVSMTSCDFPNILTIIAYMERDTANDIPDI